MYEDYLHHTGVKGMKWGRRKDRKSSGSKSKTKYVSKNRQDIAVYTQRGANRIEKRMREKGITRKQARRRETARQVATNTALVAGTYALYIAARNPRLTKALGQTMAAAAGRASGKAYGKVVNSFGGYSYANAAKYVAMNIKNKARGVSYL